MAEKKEVQTAEPQQAEVATKPTTRKELAFTPTNIDEGWRLATMLAKSGLVPRALQGKPNDLLVVLMTGRELGLLPMQSLRQMHVIEGRASMSAELMIGRCKSRSEICEYFTLIESTDKLATYKTLRKGAPQPTVLTYTIEDAEKAGLINRDNWKKQRKAMLRARAASGLARAEYSDLVEGVVIHDEAMDIRQEATELEEARGNELESKLRDRIQVEGSHEVVAESENGATEGKKEPEPEPEELVETFKEDAEQEPVASTKMPTPAPQPTTKTQQVSF